MKKSRLVEIVNNFGKARVAVLGDFCLDLVRYIQAYDLSRESPKPVHRLDEEKLYPGAAANVAYNLLSLGIPKIIPFTVIGADEEGRQLLDFFKDGIDGHNTIIRELSRRTFVYEKIWSRGDGTSTPYYPDIRIDRGSNDPLDERLEKMLTNSIGINCPSFDILIVSNYHKGVITPAVQNYATECKPIVIGTARKNTKSLVGFNYLVLNDFETASAYEPDASKKKGKIEETKIIAYGERLMHDTGCKKLIVTRGEYGMLVFEGSDVIRVPTRPKKIADITGAGDTTLAAIAAALGVGASLVEAAKIGNYAGGIVVQKPGTATASKEEILMEIENDDIHN